MHKNQQLRLIQQICFLLDASQPATSTVLQFYRKFNQAVPTSEYSNQIVVCACIFLASKIFQSQRKMRDIFNVIYCAIKLYQLARAAQSQQQIQSTNYISLQVLANRSEQQLMHLIQPNFELTQYNSLKKQVLEAEQLLLKILKFDFSIAQKKSSNYRQLLAVCDQLRLLSSTIQIAVNTYNDLDLAEQIIWVPGIIYFAVQVADLHTKLSQQKSNCQDKKQKEQKEQNQLKVQGQIRVNQNTVQTDKRQNEEAIKQSKLQKGTSFSQKEQKSQKQSFSFEGQKQQKQGQKQKIQLKHEVEWQKLFLVPIKKLQIYSEKIIQHYQKLTKQQFQEEQQQQQFHDNKDNKQGLQKIKALSKPQN